MIELLGNAPINTAATAGITTFVSILRGRQSAVYGGEDGRSPRGYTTTRGILISKRDLAASAFDKGHYFQFNPQTISDVKQTLWETRQYTGLSYNDYVWAHGGERILTFELFLDGTPGSKYAKFRPEGFGSRQARVPDSISRNGYGNDGNRSAVGKALTRNPVAENIESLVNSMENSFVPQKGPSSLDVETRVHPRGILPEVEKIQSFLYPEVLVGESIPKFAQGGVVTPTQFRPPATAVFAFGPIYLEGIIRSASVNYTLFDKDLVPLRGTINIEFAAFEFEELRPTEIPKI